MKLPLNILRMADWARTAGRWSGRVEGKDLGGTACTILFVSIDAPGKGASLHWHPYDEVFIVREGRALYQIGEETTEAGPGDILLGPARVPHRFTTLPGGRFESVDIHLSPEWIQHDLE